MPDMPLGAKAKSNGGARGRPHGISCTCAVDPCDLERLTGYMTAAFGLPEQAPPITAAYFDTARGTLWKRGWTLRVRSMGGWHRQTLRRSASGSQGRSGRQSWETETGDRVPDFAALARTPVARLLKTRRGRLAPVVERATTRTIWRALQAGAAVEVALDRGTLRTAGAAEPLCELEFALKSGPPAALFAVLRRVGLGAGLQPGLQTDEERGFALLAGTTHRAVKAEPVVLGVDMTTGAAAQVILRACLQQFCRNQLLLAGRASEPLHQARVGLRRLRSAIALFGPALRDAASGDIALRLRELSQELGAARDLDVYLSRSTAVEAVRLDREPGSDALLAALRVRREAAFDGLLATLAKPSFRQLMLDVFVWIEAGAWLTSADPIGRTARVRPFRAFAAELLEAQRRKVRTRGRGLARLSPASRHRLRIAAKKLRYASDFMASLARRPVERARHAALMEALDALQADLGDLNDIATGDALERDLARAAHLAGEPAPAANAAIAHPGREAETHLAGLLRSATEGRRSVLRAKRFWSRW